MLIRRGWPCPDPCCWSRRGKTTHTRARGSAAWPQFRFWPLVALVVLPTTRGSAAWPQFRFWPLVALVVLPTTRGSAAWPQFRFWPLVALVVWPTVVLTHSRGRCSLRRPERRRRQRRRYSGSPCWWPRCGGGCPPPPLRGSRWKKERKTEGHLQGEKSQRDYSINRGTLIICIDVAKLWHIELETLWRRGREIKQHLIRVNICTNQKETLMK